MSRQNVFLALIVRWVVVAGLALFLGAGPSGAQNNSTNYTFLVGAGFLCDQGDSSTCPAVVRSANGDNYEVSGAGTFDAQNKSVQAAGTFTHRGPNGNVLQAGVWIANGLVSFDSYGVAPGALRQGVMARGPQPLGPKRLPTSPGPLPSGGLAVFRIRLLPMSGASMNAMLQVNCALGDVPRERSVEGIRLAFERNGSEFSEEVGGRVMFLLIRPESSVPVKTSSEEPVPESAESPDN
jgi:hypothetical protein